VYGGLRRLDEEHQAPVTAAWPVDARAFRAHWLSPDGRRAVVRTRRGGRTVDGVWDTREGRHLGDVALGGECFEFSPDGKLVAEKRGSALATVALP
jgi:hypothetical protein